MWRKGAGVLRSDGTRVTPSRHQGMGARLKYRARPARSSTTLTTLGLASWVTVERAWAAVLITQSLRSSNNEAQRAINSTSISGSSP